MTSKLTNYQKVAEFHKVFQHPIRTNPDNTVFSDLKLVDLRIKLIKEEFNEFCDAVSKSDIVEVCDALADMMYVIYGAGLVFGINLDAIFGDCFKVVIEKKKYDPKLFEVKSVEINDIIKSIKNAFNNLCDAVSISSMTEVGGALALLLKIIYDAGNFFGIDLDEAFDIVHSSNMTKACINETDAKETVEDIKQKGVYKDPKYKLSDNGKYWIVYDASNGKILKSKYYKPANLTYVKAV
jgi:predicted HAD superfamily Cof-like phosphohydrolase